MLYAKVVDGLVTQYPVSQTDIRRQNSGVSFPAGVLNAQQVQGFGYVPVRYVAQPTCDAMTQRVAENAPEEINGDWYQSWSVVALTADELAANRQALQNSIVQQTQQRLDDFAKTRNYEGILSLCTYATSTNAKFQVEGQCGVEARDDTWAKLYEILAEVEAGARPAPSGFADIEPELPVLEWPA